MIKISKSYQIIFYIAILVFTIIFFFYFYHQSSVVEGDVLNVKVNDNPSGTLINNNNVDINVNLFTTDKFKNLRSDVAPVQTFDAGKRNPFEVF